MSRGLHGNATIVLSSIVSLLGVAIVVRTLVGGGGPVAQGVLVGALFALAGAGRAWMAWRMPGLVDAGDDAEDGPDGR